MRFVRDLEFAACVHLHVKPYFFTTMYNINLEKLKPLYVHGQKFKMQAVYNGAEVGDHGDKDIL